MGDQFTIPKSALKISSFTIFGDGKNKLTIPDPSQSSGFRSSDYFIKLPTKITKKLPGSVLGPQEFLQIFELELNYKLLLSDIQSLQPIVSVNKEYFSLYVYNGSANKYALKISELAVKDFANHQTRAKYQRCMFQIIKPSLAKVSQFDKWIIEDCIASSDTVLGFLCFSKKRNIKKLRIDVVCATSQGLVLLYEFSKQNKIALEIHVGYLAYGLSEGEKLSESKVPIHANYITYPQEVLKDFFQEVQKRLDKYQIDGNIFVVGDMGDAGKSIPQIFDKQYPWNKFRNDPHGSHQSLQITTKQKDSRKSQHIYFANGGYLLRAFYQLINGEYANDEVYSAKRVWSSDPRYGYGVAISTIKFF